MTDASLAPILLVALACGLDRLLGDPRRCLHPVVVMGWLIGWWRQGVESWAGDVPWRLRLGGLAITLLLVGGSALAGIALERLCRPAGPLPPSLGVPLLVVALASALAGRSLEQAVLGVLRLLPHGPDPAEAGHGLDPARAALAWIVGRDVEPLERAGILRAVAETASENAVDGLFAPLFWMLVGAALWSGADPAAPAPPGPLALAWAYKASSTLDSMLGYRQGRLRWLGTAGARLDDLLTWLPCRLVSLTLPLVATRPTWAPGPWWAQVSRSWREGRPDPSPNAGVSQAAYALAVGVQLGGANRYGGQWRPKPLLAAGAPAPDEAAVRKMLRLTNRLEALWLLLALAAVGLSGLAGQAQ